MRAKYTIPLAIAALMVTAMICVTGVTADDLNVSQPGIATNSQMIMNGSVTPMTLVLENHTYYPNDTVQIFVYNATDPAVNITGPSGIVYNLTAIPINDSSFAFQYVLDQGIILANYTVQATDNATGAYAVGTFQVITRQVIAVPPPENQTLSAQPLYLYLNVSNPDYQPGEAVGITATTNAGTPAIIIRDPVNNTIYQNVVPTGNDTYSTTFNLDKAVVLGNYTVIAYVSGNGTYDNTTAYFNVSLAAPAADNSLHIRYAAYDPVQKAIVVRASIDSSYSNVTAIVNSSPAVNGMKVKSMNIFSPNGTGNISPGTGQALAYRDVDIVIPIDNSNIGNVTSRFNLSPDITAATTSMSINANGTDIHISLNNTHEGSWYRISTSIPAGYTVQNIERDDGTEITNGVQINRSTGEMTSDDINWYVDNGTLYFYDDPINGYNITLLPPMANNSLAVNVIYGGQLSAIVFPFNQTDNNTVIASNDQLGRIGDNGYANDIDADAGSKTSIRMTNTQNGHDIIFGNDGQIDNGWVPYPAPYPAYHNGYTYSNSSSANQYVNGSQQIVGFNTVPDGSVESVFLTNFSTPQVTGAPSYVNVTQKTIIRNNNLWFATVYYITNNGKNSISNIRFTQGTDFNFNGAYLDDDDFYSALNDTVYGYKDSTNPNAIHVGGYRSTLPSSGHDVDIYYQIWYEMQTDTLNNGTSTIGMYGQQDIDGGMALSWDNASLAPGQTWAVPVIWAVGVNNSTFNSTINYAVNHNVYDVGIQGIGTPLNGANLCNSTANVVQINATAMDLGVTDQSPTVYLQVKNSAGNTVYSNSTTVALSVPLQETAPVSFNWSLAGVPSGMYNISVYTQMPGDQNSSNDLKSISVYVYSYSLYPNQLAQANPGDNVFFPLNLLNSGSQLTFDLNISPSTAGWASYLYYNNTSTLIATDTNGDGIWDWVNTSYKDPASGLPSITVSSFGNAPLILQKLVPATADTGILDKVILTAYPSSQLLNNTSAVLSTETPLALMANKTFYLQNLYLNTTPGASNGSTAITSIFSMWSQVPAFASNFMISGNISIPLYYTSSTAMPITATLFYTNGAGSSVTIGSNTSTVTASTSQTVPSLFNFTIAQSGSNITVPYGSYLVLKIDNQQTTTFNVWYNNTYRSRINVNTPTYVQVNAINTYNSTALTSLFNSSDTVNLTANVTDPIGAYDIVGATVTLTAPNGSIILNNQSMTLNMTDKSSPALWKLYNYSFNLNSTLTPGVYGINVTGYESNGVISRKNASITIMSGMPAILIYPNSTRIGMPGMNVSFKHSITNLNAYANDTVDIVCVGPPGWNINLYQADGITPLKDTNNNGIPDTGSLSPLGSTDIVIRASVPSYVNPGSVYTINVTARSSQNTSITSTVMDTVLITTTSVVKTLYLHDNGTQLMNTSMNNSTNNYTNLNGGASITWVQTPAFARNFNILDDPSLTIYAMSAGTNIDINVSILSSNATVSTVLGSVIYQANVAANTINLLNFNVPLTIYNVTVPRGSQISLNITNLNSSKLTVNQSSAYPSRIDMDTTSYINVNSVAISNSSGSIITGATPPSTVNVVANVTDPFGSFDISNVSVQMLYPNNTVAIGPLAMNLSSTDPGSPSMWKLFNSSISLNSSLDTGNYNFLVIANESNGVKSNMSAPLSISYPINVSVVKSFSCISGNNFTINVMVTNGNSHTVSGVYAYDFYASDFNESGFSQPCTVTPVNNGFLQGNINSFGPFTLLPYQSVNVTYTAQGIGNYDLANMTIVGVDPDV
jgi:hypothetical protein